MVLYDSPVVATAYAMQSSTGGHEDLRHVRARVERRSGVEAAEEAAGAPAEQEDAASAVLRDGHLLEIILRKLEPDVASRHAASEVCSAWCAVDGRTRREVTIANCYSADPHRLTGRFRNLKAIKLKCKPRAYEFGQLVDGWGGQAVEWIEAITAQYALETLHLKRAEVTDKDLERLGSKCGATLQTLVLDKCEGFSSVGLLDIGSHCRSLRIFSMIGSRVVGLQGEWLRVLAENNPDLTVLLLPEPDMDNFDDDDGGPEIEGLTALVTSCRSLRRLGLGVWKKHTDCRDILAKAPALTELGTGCFDENLCGMLPDNLTSLTGLYEMVDRHLPILLPLGATLNRLDLKYTKFSQESQLELLKICSNLEVLEVRPTVGDVGLRVIGENCSRLKKLRVERLDIDRDDDNEVTGRGLTAVARGCRNLEFLVLYAAELSNDALIALSNCCVKLNDLRLIIVQKQKQVELVPVDEGVRCILQQCTNVTKLALAMRKGCLTNAGLKHIGQYGGSKLKWLCLVCAGEEDADDDGLKHLLCHCHSLRRLELRNCPFSPRGFMNAFPGVATLSQGPPPQLKYLWIEGEPAVAAGHVLRGLSRERLHIEVSAAVEEEEQPIHEELFAYYSFRGVRTDSSSPLIQQLTDPSCVKLYSGRELSDQLL